MLAAVFAAPRLSGGRRGAAPKPQAIDGTTPLSALYQPLREGDGLALAVILQRTTPSADTKPSALSAAEAAEWVEVLEATRAGFLKYGSYGRASALTAAGRVLQRFATEPAPANWEGTLRPSHDLLCAGLEDGSLDVRVTALTEIGGLWAWGPGRTLRPSEEDALVGWKEGFTVPVVRRLGDQEPKARMTAIACLGRNPSNEAAAPAVAYLDDPRRPEVRNQVIISFAGRPGLLTEDAILKRTHDPEPIVRESAETVLKIRGLNQEQISLGSMIFHPKAEIRASVIPLIKDRSDIDPVIWLLQLSHDTEESVRVGAVDALAARLTPEVGRRLAEMAATDKSPAVRKAAVKSLLPEVGKTVSMPPLPGSPALNPKAN
ncbi:MAG: HEAT repeat domain-containing protein [Planctomycetia bacterium]|nr:HEAT repeat domain-containing protein [Planctomycetia bacterium]